MGEISLDVVFMDLERNYTSKGNYVSGFKDQKSKLEFSVY